MKLVVLTLLALQLALFAGNFKFEANKMQGRRVVIEYRYYPKTVEGDLKEVNDVGVTLYLQGNEKIVIFYESIASIKELKK
jgi:hypothetical protein